MSNAAATANEVALIIGYGGNMLDFVDPIGLFESCEDEFSELFPRLSTSG